MKVKIYMLIDPYTFKVRYIGRTRNSLKTRLNGHLSKAKKEKTHKALWINKLLKSNKTPIIKLYKIVEGWRESHKYEQRLIKKCLKHGFKLTNLDDRGEGSKNRIVSDTQKRKISNSLKEGYFTGRIKPTKTTPISFFDLEGNFLYKFDSIALACRTLNLKVSSVENVLSKKSKRLGYYQITYGCNPGKYKKRTNYTQNNKKVYLKSLTTNETLEFDSYKNAATFLNVSSPTIRRHMNKTFRNFLLSDARLKLDEFRETLEIDNPEPSL